MDLTEIVTGMIALVGAGLFTLAGLGVLRMPDLYARMHAATKASTLGIGLVALAGAVGIDGAAPKVLLAAVSIFITAPSAAHLIGRGAYRAEGIDVHLNGDDDLHEMFDPSSDEPDDGT